MRHKGADWDLPNKVQDWTQVQVALLMDIRDELKDLNSLLRCQNFLQIPRTLESIRRNTAKKKRKKPPVL